VPDRAGDGERFTSVADGIAALRKEQQQRAAARGEGMADG
jgi:hypothetical protein